MNNIESSSSSASLISCPDCGKQISRRASSCIHCGCPLNINSITEPVHGSADAMKKGRQRSQLRYDLGKVVGVLGIILSIIVGFIAQSFVAGYITAFITVSFALWIAYGS